MVVMRCSVLLLFSAITLFACGSDGPSTSQQPEGPTIVGPTQRIVVPKTMQITTASGSEGHVATEIEIWRFSEGTLSFRVWHVALDSGDLLSATIAEGSFDPGFELLPWTRYGIRARHKVGNSFSQWGPTLPIRTDDGSEAVFDSSQTADIWLTIEEPSWTSIDDEAVVDECVPALRSYYVGDMRIEDSEFIGAGIRAKGGCGSSRSLDEKSGFKVNMSWDDPNVVGCPDTRRYHGLKKLTLNNQAEDESYLHERIGYDFFQKLGVPVPRAAPIRVHVNDELWGLYLHLESIDRRFLARRFDSNDGMLYEGSYGCDLGSESCFEAKFNTDKCDDPPTGDPTDMTPLQGLNDRLSELDNFYPDIDTIVDFDLFLTTWAAGAILGYWDGYPADPNNYRIYHDISEDRWVVIPSGLDQVLEDDISPFEVEGMLAKECIADKNCYDAFVTRLNEVLVVFENSNYPQMARDIEAQIRQDVVNDNRREFSVQEWSDEVDETVEYLEDRPEQIRGYL